VRDDLPKAIGRRVRELRLERGLSQEKLAERAGLHRNYVGRVERGEPGVGMRVVAQLVAGLGISLAEFFAPFARVMRLSR
jgi:transcriptional regulator with XRE-family HTH domain